MSKVEDIRNIVQKVIGSMSTRVQDEQQAIFDAWPRIVNNKEASHTKLEGFKEETLLVNVDSSAWLYQMNLKKKKILEDLQKDFPKVKKIYFKLGKIN